LYVSDLSTYKYRSGCCNIGLKENTWAVSLQTSALTQNCQTPIEEEEEEEEEEKRMCMVS
jgi:hypothetical protein